MKNAHTFLLAPPAICIAAIVASIATVHADAIVHENERTIRITDGIYQIHIEKQGFRFAFTDTDNQIIAPAHPVSGLIFLGSTAAHTAIDEKGKNAVSFILTNRDRRRARLKIHLMGEYARFELALLDPPKDEKPKIVIRTGGIRPAFGLADHGVRYPPARSTQLVPFVDEHMRASNGFSGRLISNFVIFPKQGFAQVNIDPGTKIVRLTENETAHGSYAASMPAMVYFFGSPKTIYRNFLKVRNENGYRVFKPKYAFFGVGWEAWGALEWDTDRTSVTQNITRYLELGYPLQWTVIGSGFWPHHDPQLQATTSFGMWDTDRYPDPRGMIDHFHKLGLKVFIGLRIAFITNGPYAKEGLEKACFLVENGQAKTYHIGFPKQPVYLLDATKPEAVQWYVGLCNKWLDFGVDGFKEDLYGYGQYELRDDKVDAINTALMKQGVYVMGRNGYLGSPMDLHRIEDFNFDQNQDRGPINGLCFAYAGFPNVYTDPLGGAPSKGNLKNILHTDKARTYLMRLVRYASLNPTMAFGIGVWRTGDEQVINVTCASARLHTRLQPYIYNAAVDAYRTGFPYPLTPLPLAYPDDPEVYALANTERRSYQWLIGESLLATPLYGDDYATAQTRDVYLPAGRWMDYDTGTLYDGPRTLKQFPIPVDKTPLFVGGKGIVIEQPDDNRSLEAVVYPVAPANAKLRFTWPDGESTSTITNATAKWIPDQFSVIDQKTLSAIPFNTTPTTRAIRFDILPNHDYTVELRNGLSP